MAKITDDELQIIKLIKQDALEIASALGELSYQKLSIELEIEERKREIEKLKKREAVMLEDLKSKYGNASINIDSGEIS